MTTIDTADLRAKAQAATPGPWKALTTGTAGGDHWYICDSGEALAYISANDGSDEDQRGPNARYIAAVSPEVVVAMLDRLADQERRAAEAVALLEDHSCRDWDANADRALSLLCAHPRTVQKMHAVICGVCRIVLEER